MDPEDTENVTLNATFERDVVVRYAPASPFATIPTALVAVCGIIANIIIIILIVKFKTLRSSSNLYILNWCICNAIVLVLAPVNYNVFSGVEYVDIEVICIWFGHILIFVTGNLLFVILLTADWYSLNYSSHSCSAKCRKWTYFQIGIVWAFLVSSSIVIIISCDDGHFFVIVYALILLVNLFAFVFVCVLHCVRWIKSKTSSVLVLKSTLVLILATSYIFCWLPNNFMLTIHFVIMHNMKKELVLLTNAIAYSNSVIVLLLLRHYDKCFRECLNVLCNCAGRNEEIEDESYESVDIKSCQFLE